MSTSSFLYMQMYFVLEKGSIYFNSFPKESTPKRHKCMSAPMFLLSSWSGLPLPSFLPSFLPPSLPPSLPPCLPVFLLFHCSAPFLRNILQTVKLIHERTVWCFLSHAHMVWPSARGNFGIFSHPIWLPVQSSSQSYSRPPSQLPPIYFMSPAFCLF